MRFARIGYNDLNSGYLEGKSLGSYCKKRRFGQAFLNNYLYPMGAAIWSSPIEEMHRFPAQPTYTFWKTMVAALNKSSSMEVC